MSGHGVSDKVRDTLPEWLDEYSINAMFEEYKRLNSGGAQTAVGFSNKIQNPSQWQRFSRSRGSAGSGGWQRDYHCKMFPNRLVGMRIVTDDYADMHISEYIFRVGDRLVGGGRCSVPSDQIGGRTVAHIGARPQYQRYTLDQLQDMRLQQEYDTFTMVTVER